MPKLTLIKNGNGLFPTSRAALIEFEKLKPGVTLVGDVSGKRNLKFHRLYFALCTYIAEALNSGPGGRLWTQEMVSDAIKIGTGRADVIPLSRAMQAHYGAQVALKPQSISFAKMDETEFGQLVEAGVAYVLNEFGFWIQNDPNWKNVQEIILHSQKGIAA